MSLRPRYSLLTLLIITALVAGSIKLWRGPYHVVEPAGTDEDAEYTYTRDWQGVRIILGPLVNRKYYAGKLGRVEVKYYRQGVLLDWHYYCLTELEGNMLEPFPAAGTSPLTSEEQAEFRATVERVKLKKEPGQSLYVEESYFPEFPR